jgi:hypothetical protein
MSDVDFGRTARASCAMHPDVGATGTCSRCGNFMCDTCSENGTSPHCPTCRQRAGASFPLHRDAWTVGQLWDVCWKVFQREWGMLSLAALISLGVTFGAQLFINVGAGIGAAVDSVVLAAVLGVVGFVGQQVVQGLVQLGLLRVCFDALEGRRVDVARLFSQMHKVVPYLLTLLLIMLIVVVPLALLFGLGALAALGAGALNLADLNEGASTEQVMESLVPFLGIMAMVSVVLVVPLAYALLPLYLVNPEIAYEEVPPSPTRILRDCWEAARGQRLAMFGVGLIAAAAMVVGTLMCCVGLVPAMALGQLLMAGLYLTLRPRRDDVVHQRVV